MEFSSFELGGEVAVMRDSILACSLTSAAVCVWMYAVSLGMLLTACLSLAAAAVTMEEDVGVPAIGVGGAESMAERGVLWREEERRSRGAGLEEEEPFLLLEGAIVCSVPIG